MLPSTGLIKKTSLRLFRIVFPLSLKVIPGGLKKYDASFFAGMTGLSTKMLLRYESKYPDSMKTMIKHLKSYTSEKQRYSKVSNMIILNAEKYMIIDKYFFDDPVIITAGFVQLTASVFVPPNPKKDFLEEDIQEYIEKIPCPDKVVFLKSSPETCLKRMKKRSKGYPYTYHELTEKNMLKRLKDCNACFEVAVEHLNSMEVDVIEIDAEKPVKEIIEDIESKVNF